MTAVPISVFYDGLCPLCSREIAHYRKQIGDAPVAFVDIAAVNFDPLEHDIDLGRAREVLHVKVGTTVHTGVDAAIAMWEAIPAYRWLARVMRWPGIHGLADVGYRIFASFRPYLQRGRRHPCATDTCRR
jgi:predicted DCC family thiol-disulfide oxidoreductase YuxK